MKYLIIILLAPTIVFASMTGDFQQCIESLCGEQEQIVKNRSKQTPIDLSNFSNHLERLDKAISNSYSALTQSLPNSDDLFDIERLTYLVGIKILEQNLEVHPQFQPLLKNVEKLQHQLAKQYPWTAKEITTLDTLISSYSKQLNMMSDLINEESAYDPFAEDYFAPYVDYVERWLDHPEMLNRNDLSQISETMSWLSSQLGYKKPEAPRVDCLKFECKSFISIGIFKLFQYQLEADKGLCKTTFLDVVKSAPSTEEISNFKKVIRQSIKQIKQRVFPRLNLDTAAAEQIDTLNVSLPRNRVTLAKDAILFLEKISDSNIQRWKQLTTQSLIENELNLNASFANICSKLTSRVTDHYDRTNHRINISEYSAKNPSFGAYVFSHEVGHAISKVFTNPTKSRVNACLKRLHKNSSELLEANHFVEEDFADMVAAIATYDSTKNGACLFWYHDAKNSKYNIGVKSIYSYSINDKHSSNFFRLMHLQQFRTDEMPISCEASLQNIEDHATIHRCLWP